MNNNLPIGIFDSGVGGLTVLHSLQQYLPEESYLYLGDTARLPYGTKSAETVTHYALKAANVLVKKGVKLLVVACNTASSVALSTLSEHFPQIPIIGVIDPSAQAACRATRNQRIAVIATEATVQAQSYHKAIQHYLPQAVVSARSCNLFIALAEEGWADNDIAVLTAEKYLTPLLADPVEERADVLVLGCTHFPLLQPAITQVVNGNMQIISSAQAAAQSVSDYVEKNKLHAQGQAVNRLLVTDNLDRFSRMATLFLKQRLSWQSIELVNL